MDSKKLTLPKINSNDEHFKPVNWKAKSKRSLEKIHPVQRSKYLAYEEPDQDVKKGINFSKMRILEVKKKEERFNPLDERAEREKYRHDQLVGQLKAAEARNRVNLLRSKYYCKKGDEINRLITCQPTAIKAVRLQSLLPNRPARIKFHDVMEKDQRFRVEGLIEDELGLKTGRILT